MKVAYLDPVAFPRVTALLCRLKSVKDIMTLPEEGLMNRSLDVTGYKPFLRVRQNWPCCDGLWLPCGGYNGLAHGAVL